MDILDTLSRTPPFVALPPPELKRLAASSRRWVLSRGQRVYAEGDPAAWTYVLTSGRAHIARAAPDGRLGMIEIIRPGEIFGCVGCAGTGGYPCEAVADQASEAVALPNAAVAKLLDSHPGFARALHADMGRRLREAQNLRALGGDRVERRIAGVLLWLEGKFGRHLPFSRQAIAEMASTTSESTIRTLIRWRRRGYVTTGWKQVTLQDPAALRNLLDRTPA